MTELRRGEARQISGESEAHFCPGSEESLRAVREHARSGEAPGASRRTDFNDSNRPVRTWMPGGGGGEVRLSGRPYPDAGGVVREGIVG